MYNFFEVYVTVQSSMVNHPKIEISLIKFSSKYIGTCYDPSNAMESYIVIGHLNMRPQNIGFIFETNLLCMLLLSGISFVFYLFIWGFLKKPASYISLGIVGSGCRQDGIELVLGGSFSPHELIKN